MMAEHLDLDLVERKALSLLAELWRWIELAERELGDEP